MWLRPAKRGLAAGLAGLALLVTAVPASATPESPQASWDKLAGGSILLIRHANAPGLGDPAGFKLYDCSSQRNLDDAGRAQARRIGTQLRGHGVAVGAVLTS